MQNKLTFEFLEDQQNLFFIVKGHAKQKKNCHAISSILCFVNYYLNNCKCDNYHEVKLESGYSKIIVSKKCTSSFFIKEAYSFLLQFNGK